MGIGVAGLASSTESAVRTFTGLSVSDVLSDGAALVHIRTGSVGGDCETPAKRPLLVVCLGHA